MVCRQPKLATARSKIGGQIVPARYVPLEISAKAEPRRRSNQRLTYMYKGALMLPTPIRPINAPCPIHRGQGGPNVEMARPSPIMREPKITVVRAPTRSATWAMMMPPTPEPNQAGGPGSAGMGGDFPPSLAWLLTTL